MKKKQPPAKTTDDHRAGAERLLAEAGPDREKIPVENVQRQAEEALLKAGALQKAIFNSANFSSIATDAKGVIQIFNVGAERMLGYKAAEVVDKITPAEISDPQEGIARAAELSLELETTITPGFEALVFKASRGIEDIYELTYIRKDGSRFPAIVSVTALRDAQDTIIGYLLIGTDNTARKQAEEKLKTAAAFLENVFASSVDPLFTVDEHGRFTRWNQAATETYGFSAECVAVHKVFDLYADKDAMERMLGQLSRDGFVRDYEIDMQKKDKVIAPFSLSIRLLRDENGKRIGSVAMARDLTETRKALAALGQANTRLKNLVEESDRCSREATLITSMSESLQSCLYAEEAYRIIAGFAQKLFTGQSGALFLLGPSENILEVVTAWGDPLVTEEVFLPEDCWAIRRGQVYLSGEEIPCRHLPNISAGFYVCLPLVAQGQAFGLMHLQGNKEVTPLVGKQLLFLARIVADHISLALANLKLRATLHHQVMHDPLTGLFNRRYMDVTLEREIPRVRRKRVTLGVIMLDLDHFKRFNDTYGHQVGDGLLQTLGKFLETHVRQGDIACRYGGEEFVLILPEASLDVTQKRAEEIRREVPHLQVVDRGRPIASTTVSLGVSIFPDHGATWEDVLRAADDAMYKAKAAGRDQVVVAERITASSNPS